MPVVPRADPGGVTLAPVAERRAVATATPEQFGATQGRDLQRVGQAGAYAADALGQRAVQMADLQRVNAERLQVKRDAEDLRRFELEYAEGVTGFFEDPEKGVFATRTGVHARNVTKDSVAHFDKLERDTIFRAPAHLKGEVEARIRVRRLSDEPRAARFESEQTRRAEAESFKAILQTSATDAANAADPKARMIAQARGEVEISNFASANGWSAEQRDNERARFRDVLHTGVIESMLSEDPTGATARAYFDKHGEQIDPGSRAAITDRFQRIENAQAAARERREAQAERAVAHLERLAESGYPLRPQDVAAVNQVAAGTQASIRLAIVRDNVQAMAKFGQLPPALQAQALQAEDERLRTAGAGDGEVARLRQFQRVHQATVKALASDPLAWAAQQGVAPEVPPLNFRDERGTAANLAARRDIVAGLERTHGAGRKLLHPGEVDAIAADLKDKTPDERAAFLRTLHAGIGDPSYYAATVGQLAPGAPLTAFAGRLALEEAPGAAPLASTGSAASLVLEGDALLNPPKDEKRSPFKLPAEPERRGVFNAATGELFANAPEAYAQLRSAVDAVYAAQSARAGDYSGEIDEKRYRDAIDRVTGGVVEVNGRRVIKPYNMPEDVFSDTLGNVAGADVAALGGVEGYSPDEAAEAIRDGELVNYGDGYAVLDGGRYLMRPDGNVFVWRPAATLVRPFRR